MGAAVAASLLGGVGLLGGGGGGEAGLPVTRLLGVVVDILVTTGLLGAGLTISTNPET